MVTNSLPIRPGAGAALLRGSGRSFKVALLLLVALLAAKVSFGQSTIFRETFGNSGGTVAVSSYSGWANPSLTFAATASAGATIPDVRITSVATGYTDAVGPATGSGAQISNIFMGSQATGTNYTFTIGGINTTGYSSITLSLGGQNSGTIQADAVLALSYSTDGITFTPFQTFNNAALVAQGTSWGLRGPYSLPAGAATSNLRIRITKTTSTPSGSGFAFRFDDVLLRGVAAVPTILTPSTTFTDASVISTYTFLNQAVTGTGSAIKTFNVQGSNLTGNLNVSVAGAGLFRYRISPAGAWTTGATALPLSPSGGTVNQDVDVQLISTTNSAGAQTAVVTLSSAGATSQTFNLNYQVASATVNAPTSGPNDDFNTADITNTLRKFITSPSQASEPKGFTVSGNFLSNPITVVAPSGYEVSSAYAGTYTGSAVTSAPVAGSVSQVMYIRLASGTAVGSAVTGTVQLQSSPATTVTFPVKGQAYNTSLSVIGTDENSVSYGVPSFSAGNIIVTQLGDGDISFSGATGALNITTPVFLVEIDKSTGTEVQRMLVPVANNGGNYGLTLIGNSTTSGEINQSPDGKYIVISGYNAPPGLQKTYASNYLNFKKVIATINYRGQYVANTIINAYDGDNIRAAATLTGAGFWTIGTNASSPNSSSPRLLNMSSLRYIAAGTNAYTTDAGLSGRGKGIWSAANQRHVVVTSQSELYVASGSGTPSVGIIKVAGGLPTDTISAPIASQQKNVVSNAIAPNPYQFSLADVNNSVSGTDVMYIADLNLGVLKLSKSFSGANELWSSQGSLSGTTVTGTFPVKNGSNIDLYFTSNSATLGQGKLFKVTDGSPASTIVNNGQAATSQATFGPAAPSYAYYRGISTSPLNVTTADITSTFTPATSANLPQNTNVVVYSVQDVVATSTTLLTNVSLAVSGTYTAADNVSFTLYTSNSATFSVASASPQGSVIVPAGGAQTVDFGSLAVNLPIGTTYIYVVAKASGCATVGHNIQVATSPISLSYSAANVTGTAVTGNTFTVSAGVPDDVLTLVPDLGDPTIPLTFTAPSCFVNGTDHILIVADRNPITVNPSATSYTANAAYGAGQTFGATGYVVYYGNPGGFTLSGLTVPLTYNVKAFVQRGSTTFYSPGFNINVQALQTVYYTCASGTDLTAKWSNQSSCPAGGATIPSTEWNNVTDFVIQYGHTVNVNSANLSARNLTVNNGGTLNTTNAAVNYLNVYGNVTNNGTIGSPSTFLAFDMYKSNQVITGTGFTTLNRITNFTGGTNVGITFDANVTLNVAATAALYNNVNTSTLNYTINPGKTVTVSNGDVSIAGIDGTTGTNRGGSLTVNGTLNITNGTLYARNRNVNGTAATNFTIGAAGTINAKTTIIDQTAVGGVSSPAPFVITAGGKLVITNKATIVSGTFNSAGLRLVSTSTTQATLDQITTAAVTGAAVIERNYPTVGWHYVCYPIKGTTFSAINAGLRVSPANNANLIAYTENDTTTTVVNGTRIGKDGWRPVSSLSNNVNAGGAQDQVKGYRFYVSSPFTATFTGVPVTGNVSSPVLTLTANGYLGSANNGYNLIGNPYPAYLDWNNVMAANAAKVQGNAYYLYNPVNGHTVAYSSTTGVVGTADLGSRYISPGQGYFVRTLANGNQLNFTETMKNNSGVGFVREGAGEPNRISLKMANASSEDEAVVWFRTDATEGVDASLDVAKMSGVFNISTMTSTSKLAINATANPTAETIIPVAVDGVEGTYTIRFAGLETMDGNIQLYLRDNYLHTMTAVQVGATYAFSITSNAASTGTHRFELVAAPAGVTAIAPKAILAQLSIQPNPANADGSTLSVSSMKGKEATVTILATNGATVATSYIALDGAGNGQTKLASSLPAGVYVVRVADAASVSTQKWIVR